MNFAKNYFQEIIIWTAAIKEYAETITNFLFGNNHNIKVLHREDCVPHANTFTKPINIISNKYGIGDLKLLLVDDRLDNFALYPHNGYLIPEYKGSSKDEELIKLAEWLVTPEVYRCDIVPDAVIKLNNYNELTD